MILLATWSFVVPDIALKWVNHYANAAESGENTIAFSGWLLITDDENWREKWDTPEQSIPSFKETHEVGLGQKITILTFYRNPLLDDNGWINIRCDITITKPDSSVSFHQEDMECAREKLQGNPNNLRLTYVIIDFIGEIGDPYGRWEVEVTLKDENSGIELPLRTYFELVNTSRFTRWKPAQKRGNNLGLPVKML